MNEKTKAALERLLYVGSRDSGQSRRVTDFLLSWWNAETCGKFDPTDMWGLDADIRVDVVTVLIFISGHQNYPDALGYGPQFNRLVAEWRPHLVNK